MNEWINVIINEIIGVVCEIWLRLSYMDIDVIIYIVVYYVYC